MQYTFIINGTSQLVLIPENELDRLLLERTLDNGATIEVSRISQPISILGKPVTDSYVLKRKVHSTVTALNKEDDTSET
mgnify:CR=1 FL=1|jgi:hypothetical protein